MSIPYYFSPDKWEIKKEGKYNVRVTIGEIEDYFRYPPINVTMHKDTYNRIMNGEYEVRREGRGIGIYRDGVKIDTE